MIGPLFKAGSPATRMTARLGGHHLCAAAAALGGFRGGNGIFCRYRRRRWAPVLVTLLFAPAALAAGTDAGARIPNTVSVDYSMAGVPRRAGTVTTFWVDELLEVSVVSADASALSVVAGELSAIQQYTLTNLGNGQEAFRLAARDGLGGDDFDPALTAIYLETNSTPGLQIGPSGDELYVAGSNDPLLPPDATQTVYLTADIPAGVSVTNTGLLELRAVASTIVAASGTDDPAQSAFPGPGTSFPALGDVRDGDSQNVDAMVGVSYDASNALYADQHDYLVGDVGVTINKSAFAVRDPLGGATVVPGSIVSYRVSVDVSAGGTAGALRINDPLPADLVYDPKSLAVVGLPAGEEPDDDLEPAGVDNTGVTDGVIEVNFGDVVGPTNLTIEYQAVVR